MTPRAALQKLVCALAVAMFIIMPVRSTAHGSEMPRIPETPVINQDGQKLKFYSDLIKGRTVVIDFIFTGCGSTCPILTAKLAKVQSLLASSGSDQPQFISISVDPFNDGPAELKAFANKFGVTGQWSFVTGEPSEIIELVKVLGGATGLASSHSDFILIGDEATGRWGRRSLDASPESIAASLREIPAQKNTKKSTTAEYFSNLPVLDQRSQKKPFYDSYIRDQLVLIDFIFTRCKDICPVTTQKFARVQKLLPGHPAENVRLISITVDPEHDSPGELLKFISEQGIVPGWSFLTGKKENIDWINYRLGGFTEEPQQHNTVIIVGNDQTGDWRKLPPDREAEEILQQLDELALKKPAKQLGLVPSSGDERIRLGRSLYEDTSSKFKDGVQVAGMPVPAGQFACINCHGVSGIGKTEATLSVPPINWASLAQPRASDGIFRSRVGYDAATFARVLRFGIDANGQHLSQTMPTFAFNDDEVASLLGYLKAIGSIDDNQQGISDQTLALGALLPLAGPKQALGYYIKNELSAAIESANKQGGVFGRKLKLTVLDSGPDGASHIAAARKLTLDGAVFGLIASVGPAAIDDVARTVKIPLIAGFEGPSRVDATRNSYYLLPGSDAEANTLLAFASGSGKRRCAVVDDGTVSSIQNVTAGIRDCNVKSFRWSPLQTIDDVLTFKPDVVIVLTGEIAFRGVAAELRQKNSHMPILTWSPLLAAVATLPPDERSEIMISLPFTGGSPGENVIGMLAQASTDLMVQALRRSGRGLSQTSFTQALESTAGFDVNGLPHLQFQPNQAMQARPLHIVKFSESGQDLLPLTQWIVPFGKNEIQFLQLVSKAN
jgi:protein SCO1